MNTKVLTTLEYNKIIDLLTERPTLSPVKSFAAIWCLPLIFPLSEPHSGRPKMPWPVSSVLEAPLLAATEI